MELEQNTHQELKYLGMIILYFIIVFPIQYFFTPQISSWNPVVQFVLVNLLTYFILFFIFKAVALNMGIFQLIMKSFGTVLAFLSLDIIQPEFHIGFNGVLNAGTAFGKASSDYFFGYIYSSMGIHGFLLWLFVYPITCLALLVTYALIEKNFVKEI